MMALVKLAAYMLPFICVGSAVSGATWAVSYGLTGGPTFARPGTLAGALLVICIVSALLWGLLWDEKPWEDKKP